MKARYLEGSIGKRVRIRTKGKHVRKKRISRQMYAGTRWNDIKSKSRLCKTFKNHIALKFDKMHYFPHLIFPH